MPASVLSLKGRVLRTRWTTDPGGGRPSQDAIAGAAARDDRLIQAATGQGWALRVAGSTRPSAVTRRPAEERRRDEIDGTEDDVSLLALGRRRPGRCTARGRANSATAGRLQDAGPLARASTGICPRGKSAPSTGVPPARRERRPTAHGSSDGDGGLSTANPVSSPASPLFRLAPHLRAPTSHTAHHTRKPALVPCGPLEPSRSWHVERSCPVLPLPAAVEEDDAAQTRRGRVSPLLLLPPPPPPSCATRAAARASAPATTRERPLPSPSTEAVAGPRSARLLPPPSCRPPDPEPSPHGRGETLMLFATGTPGPEPGSATVAQTKTPTPLLLLRDISRPGRRS